MPSNRLDKNFSRGKQELDIDNKFLPDGSYRYGMNIEVANSESSDAGVIQSVRGNKTFNTHNNFIINPTNAVIGSYADNINDKIYWFWVGPPEDNEGIYELDLATNTIHRILEFTRDRRVLNFSPDNLITGITFVDGVLYWCDGVKDSSNRPKKVEVDRFRNSTINPTSDNDGVLVSNVSNIITGSGTNGVTINQAFNDDVLTVALRPPLFAPTIVNPTSTDNYGTPGSPLYEDFVSFATRYVYRNRQVSPLSPFTQAAFFPENFSVSRETGILNCMVNRYNSIDVMFDTGSSEVIEVEVVFKRSNSNAVYVLASINKDDNSLRDSTPYQTRFGKVTYDTTKVYRLLPSDQLTRVYDIVPLKAQALEFVGNRLVYGNFIQNNPLTVDTPSGDVIVPDFTAGYTNREKTETDMSPSKTCKADRDYEIAITYFDKYGVGTDALIPRREGLIGSNSVHIPLSEARKRNKLTTTINHRAPFWATHYRVNIKQTRGAFYNIFPTGIAVSTADNKAYLQIPSLEDATTTNEVSGISSTINKVAKDDIILLKSFSKDEILDAEIERREFRVLEVGFIDATNVMEISDNGIYITVAPVVNADLTYLNTIPAADQDTTIWETIPDDTNLALFPEYNQTFRCTNGVHTASRQEIIRDDDAKQVITYNPDNTFNSITSVELTFDFFNCYSYTNGCESMHVRDEFFGTALEASARANVVTSEYEQVDRTTNLIHSGRFNDDTNRNGLNDFNPSQPIITEVDMNDGPIQKLYARDTNLIVFQEDKVKVVPIDKNLIQTAGGGQQLTVDSRFFGTESAYPQNYGISNHPESFAEYGAAVYWVDANRGAVCKLSANGIEEISQYGIESLIRTDSRSAPEIWGGFDQYHKRYFITLKNTPGFDALANTDGFEISSIGSFDPQAECLRDIRTVNFRPVYAIHGGEVINSVLDVEDTVFVDNRVAGVGGLTTFNGDYKWFTVRSVVDGVVNTDRVVQITPDGVVSSLVTSCDVSYPLAVNHIPFNISSERFDDEYDACANGLVDSVAYLGCPLDSNGRPTTCTLTSTSEPAPGFIIYEGEVDLIPSSRTGWYLTTEDDGLYVIYVEEGAVIRKLDCASISQGRRQITGSGVLDLIATESDFDRNFRLCNASTNMHTYFWTGGKDRPVVGDVIHTNDVTDTLAGIIGYIVFEDGYWVRLTIGDATTPRGSVVTSGSCFTQVCTNDIGNIFTQNPTVPAWVSTTQYVIGDIVLSAGNTWEAVATSTGETPSSTSTFWRQINPAYVLRYDGTATFLNAEIEWRVVAQNAYPSSGVYTQVQSQLVAGEIFALSLPEGTTVVESTFSVIVTNVCYRRSNVAPGTSLIHITAVGTSTGALCGATTVQTLYYNQDELIYYTDSAMTAGNEFATTGLHGVSTGTLGDNATLVYDFTGNGRANAMGTVYCDRRHELPLSFSETAGQGVCSIDAITYYANEPNFDSTSVSSATTLILDDGTRTVAPDGYYSDKTHIRRLVGGVLGANEATGCTTLVQVVAQFGTTSQIACHSGTNVNIFPVSPTADNSRFNADTTAIYADAVYGNLAQSGFYQEGNMVGEWNATTRVFTFIGTCPVQLPLYTFASWISNDGGVTINEDAELTIADGGAASVTVVSTSPPTLTPGGTDVDYDVNLSIEVPAGFRNAGEFVTGTIQDVTRPARTFAFSDWTGDVTIAADGTLTFDNGNAANAQNLPAQTFPPIAVATDQTINVRLTVPAVGYSNSGNPVSGTLIRTQPATAFPTFVQSDWTGSISITQQGVVSVANAGNGAPVTFTPATFQANTGQNAVDRTVSVTVTVPATGFDNSGMTITFNLTVSQPGLMLPAWSSSVWTGSIDSISQAGAVSFTNGNGTVTITGQTPSGANTGAQARDVVVSYSVDPPTVGFTGNAFTDSVTLSQPGLPTFAFSDWSGTVAVAAAGTISATRGNSAATPVINTANFGTVTTNTPRSINVTITVPSGFSNSGRTLTGNRSAIQPLTQPIDFLFTDWTGGATVNAAGDIAIDVGNAASATNTPQQTFPRVSTATDRGINITLVAPAGYGNAGNNVTGTVTDSQEATDFTISAATAGVDLSWGYTERDTRSVAITTTPDNGTWGVQSEPPEFTAVKNGNNLDITSNGPTVTGGHTGNIVLVHSSDANDTVSITVEIEAQPITRSIGVRPSSLSFGSGGGATDGDGVVTVLTLPDANDFSWSASASWINVVRIANELTITLDELVGISARNGTITVVHRDDSSLTASINISQSGFN